MEINGAKIFITGGTGTLGHAIIELSHRNGWDNQFTIYSRSELLQANMRERYPDLQFILGDIRDYDRLQESMRNHSIVFHLAAMKRVPECEQQPTECYRTNVEGSINVMQACKASGAVVCVGASSNKACRATGVYGASKLMMEKVFMAAPKTQVRCAFTLIRCGNVVGSRGSIVSTWRKQAAEGKPLTVIDKAMTRFFLSPLEMAHMMFLAIAEPAGSILIRKEQSLSIGELAQIIAPHTEIIESGHRAGDRQHEELLHSGEAVAYNDDEYFVVSDHGTHGQFYTSLDAPRLLPNQFISMLEDSDSLGIE